MSNQSNIFPILMGQMSKTPHLENALEDCESSINYTMQHILIVMIQKITGHQTHVIFNNILAEIDKIYKQFKIDPKKKTATMKWIPNEVFWFSTHNKIRKALIVYPNTDIKFYVSIKIQYIDELDRWDSGKMIHGKWIDKQKITENTNYIEISVYVPQKRIVFSDTTMQEVLAEGDLLDMSIDIEEPELKTDSIKNKKKGGSDHE